jgi:cystathionine gamma-lyase
MNQHSQSALTIALFLESHEKVREVVYPGLVSHPQHEIAKRQMRDFGGIITIQLKGGIREARQFLENTDIFLCAESLGAVESLLDHPAIMTHAAVPEAQRIELGISDSMVRISVGVENVEDLIKDLEKGLAAMDL